MDDADLPSYEAATAECFISPSAPPLPVEEKPEDIFSELTDEEIREACYKHAEKNSDKGASAIKQMEFKNVFRSCSYHYKLETFTEKREVSQGYSHYYKQNIDGPKNGPEPDMWSVTVELPSPFQAQQLNPLDYSEPIIIPHTEQVKTCHQCDGRAKEDCLICEGAGWTYCLNCEPSTEKNCQNHSPGHVSCNICNKTGRIRCRVCEGYKKLKHYKELKVTWQTHTDHFVLNSSKIPESLLQSSACKELYREERSTVEPIRNFSHLFLINEASLRLIEKHKRICGKDEVIRMQRQTLRAVPITRVNCEYKDKELEFYVFGLENSVYTVDSLTKSPSCCIS